MTNVPVLSSTNDVGTAFLILLALQVRAGGLILNDVRFIPTFA